MLNITTILAIETSCDETGVAVVQKKGNEIKVLAQALAFQVDIHAMTGGVVPEVAAREHVQVLAPLVEKVFTEASVSEGDINAIAVTVGPGLMPALSVGVTAAKTLAYAWNKPIVPIHHIEGHIYSALLGNNEDLNPTFPVLALIVSGGHTMLIEMKKHLSYEILGTTQDDAAGEAFDKVARLLGLPYPGGPNLNKVANTGNPKAFHFPRPMIKSDNLNFSFSGLKTSVLYAFRAIADEKKDGVKADVAASFQAAVIDTLVTKTGKAILQLNPKVVLLAGGVAANNVLQEALQELGKRHSVRVQIAPTPLTGDNAVMIGQVGVFAYEAGRKEGWESIDAIARFPITTFSGK